MADDHNMLSSDDEVAATTTPAIQTDVPGALTSPPGSQHTNAQLASMPVAASASASANANGKRPLMDISTASNGDENDNDIQITDSRTTNAAMATKKVADFPPRTHEASGYTWTRAEDEPGYAWLCKKAADEGQRAWEVLLHKDAGFTRKS